MKKRLDPQAGIPLYRRLLSYTWPYKGIFLLAVFGMLAHAATDTGFAALMRPILDAGFVERDRDFISQIPWLIIGLFFIRGLTGIINVYCIRWVGRRVIFDIRKDMFTRLIHLPNKFYDRHSSASLVSKLIYDVEQLAEAATSAVTILVKDMATLVFLLGYMAMLNWKLTAMFAVIGPLLAWFVKRISGRFRVVSGNIQASVGDIAHVVKEAAQGHRILKVFGGQQYEAENFFQTNNNNRQQAMKKATVAALSVPVTEFMAAAALSWIIYLATQPTGESYITAGTFVSYLTAMLLMMGPGRRLTKVTESLQAGLAAAQSVFGLIDEAPEEDTGKVRLKNAKGRIEYRNVGFHYGSSRKGVLHDISFHIEPGQTVALVGASGAGKSSIAALLPKFYRVEEGAILIDGIDINDLILSDLRRNISMVTQETILFDDTIRNNIAYGHPGPIPQTMIEKVTSAAHVTEFIAKFPKGLDTRIGEHGVRLSGGQRQRVAIARALFKDAPILILDEATSSLDTESERQVQDALQTLMANRTTLVIAHRLSTIEHADRILVLKRGRIVETGTHQDLLNANRDYARLYQTQFSKRA